MLDSAEGLTQIDSEHGTKFNIVLNNLHRIISDTIDPLEGRSPVDFPNVHVSYMGGSEDYEVVRFNPELKRIEFRADLYSFIPETPDKDVRVVVDLLKAAVDHYLFRGQEEVNDAVIERIGTRTIFTPNEFDKTMIDTGDDINEALKLTFLGFVLMDVLPEEYINQLEDAESFFGQNDKVRMLIMNEMYKTLFIMYDISSDPFYSRACFSLEQSIYEALFLSQTEHLYSLVHQIKRKFLKGGVINIDEGTDLIQIIDGAAPDLAIDLILQMQEMRETIDSVNRN